MKADDLNMPEDELVHEPAVGFDACTGQAPTWQIATHPFVVHIDEPRNEATYIGQYDRIDLLQRFD